MFTSRGSLAFLLLCLCSTVDSSPVPFHTPAPSDPLQISPPTPAPTNLPSLPSPYLSTPSSGEWTGRGLCPLTMTPSVLVVRFGDPATANCSVSNTGFSLLGWEVSLGKPEVTMAHFLVWTVNNMSDWGIKPACFALAEQGGQCQRNLSLIVYKPPDSVSISFQNHTGPMSEGHSYTLLCTVHGVAPVENLTVTFYKGQTLLTHMGSKNTLKTQVTEIFSLNIWPSKEDDGVQYWCKAMLHLGPDGPQPPPVAVSPNLTVTVHFGPQLACPPRMCVKEGEGLRCKVMGNPPPLVNWYRDGENVTLPTHLKRRHAGKYTVWAEGVHGKKNFTVEVEVLPMTGTADSFRLYPLGVLLLQVIYWL